MLRWSSSTLKSPTDSGIPVGSEAVSDGLHIPVGFGIPCGCSLALVTVESLALLARQTRPGEAAAVDTVDVGRALTCLKAGGGASLATGDLPTSSARALLLVMLGVLWLLLVAVFWDGVVLARLTSLLPILE